MQALITGITGQDGSYLAELLLYKGYQVHGLVRRMASDNDKRYSRINHILDRITLHPGTIESFGSVLEIIAKVECDECYHLAAQSYVPESFIDAFTTFNTNINGTHHLLSALRQLRPKCRFYFAGSSEMFGKVTETPQNETTRFHPRSPYAISKVAGFDLTRNYREAYGMHASSGILFNHESPRRGPEFVTRKISLAVARIKAGLQHTLVMGNMDAKRDWGFAGEYVEAMWRMLQQPEPDDYVIATGQTHSIAEFCEMAFSSVGLDVRKYLRIDRKFIRPAEVALLCGDASKAQRVLGWKAMANWHDLACTMVQCDMKALAEQAASA